MKHLWKLALWSLVSIGCSASLSTKDWMQKVSGVEIPPGARSVAIYEEHEVYKALYCQLPIEDAIRITNEARFTADPPRSFYEIEVSDLPKAYTKGPMLRYTTGASDYNAWDAVVDISTGEMWLLVESPDFGGDLPERALKSRTKN